MAPERTERKAQETSGQGEGRLPEKSGSSGSGSGGSAQRPRLGPVAARGAAGGAAVGAVLGGALAVARVLRPEQAEALKQTLADAGRDVATAAVRAAGGVLTTKPVSDLLAASRGNGGGSDAVKQTAKEVGVAAASAARDAIVSMRNESERGQTKS